MLSGEAENKHTQNNEGRTPDDKLRSRAILEAEFSKLITSLHSDHSGHNEKKIAEENPVTYFNTEFSLIVSLLDKSTWPISESMLQHSKLAKMGLLGDNLVQTERLVKEVLESRFTINKLRVELESRDSKERQHELEISAYLDQINILKNIISSNRTRLIEIDLELERYQVERSAMTTNKINLESEIASLTQLIEEFFSYCHSLVLPLRDPESLEYKDAPVTGLEEMGCFSDTLQQVKTLVLEVFEHRRTAGILKAETALLRKNLTRALESKEFDISQLKAQLSEIKCSSDAEIVKLECANDKLQHELNEYISSALRITSEYSDRASMNEREYSETLCIARQELNACRCKLDVLIAEKSMLEAEVTRLSVLVQTEVGEKIDKVVEIEGLQSKVRALEEENEQLRTSMRAQKALLESEITRLVALAESGETGEAKQDGGLDTERKPTSSLESLLAESKEDGGDAIVKDCDIMATRSELTSLRSSNRALQQAYESLREENYLKTKELTTLQLNYLVFFMIGAVGWLV